MLLKEIREEMGLTGAEFARRIGASPGQLHDWENGRQLLTVEAAVRIEASLGRKDLVPAVVAERKAKALGERAA